MIAANAVEETVTTPLARELNVLSSLAHFGWLNTQHLHALCFHGLAGATVRTTLRYFEEANWIRHVRWRIGSPEGGHIWAIQLRGLRLIEQYLPVVPQVVSDLSRPTSALEHEEWRIQLAVRDFVTRFVLEARQRPLIATAALAVPAIPWKHALAIPILQSDAVVSLGREAPAIQSSSWLPWNASASPGCGSTQVTLYCDRTATPSHIPWLIRTVINGLSDASPVAMLVLNNDDRQTIARDTVRELGREATCRITTWPALEHDLLELHDSTTVLQPAA